MVWRTLSKLIFPATLLACSTNLPAVDFPPQRPIESSENIHEVAHSWLDKNLTYKYDKDLYKKNDFWAPCSLTYINRGGDCEDYSICAAVLMDRHIEQGYIITLYDNVSSGKGHAFLAYRIRGRWGTISNQEREYVPPKFHTLHDAIVNANKTRKKNKRYQRYEVIDYSGVDLIYGKEDLEEKMRKIGSGKLQP